MATNIDGKIKFQVIQVQSNFLAALIQRSHTCSLRHAGLSARNLRNRSDRRNHPGSNRRGDCSLDALAGSHTRVGDDVRVHIRDCRILGRKCPADR